MPPLKQRSRDSPNNLCATDVSNMFLHDLLTITEVGQQSSRMTRLIIITAAIFLASENQIQLVIMEFGDLGHQTGSFSPT